MMNKIYCIFWVIIILPLILFSNIWYVDCEIAQSGNGTIPEEAFQTIHEAIDCYTIAEYDTILVFPGTYYEETIISVGFPDNITIASNFIITEEKAYIESTIIDGDETDAGIFLQGPERITICGFTITNCYNNSGNYAAGISIGSFALSSNYTNISNCIISNCVNDDIGGGAIRITAGRYSTIESCIIEGNTNDRGNTVSPNWAAGIAIYGSCYLNYITIDDCIIRGNIGGGIDLITFGVSFIDVLTVENTLICENITKDDGAGIDLDFSSLEMNRCTIVNNCGSIHLDDGIAQSISETNYQNISNSIILDTSNFYDDDIIKYCGHLDDDSMEPNSSNGSIGNFETIAADCFISGDDLYRLSWDSPCIDAGDPDNDGDSQNWVFDEDDQDADGSRLSIGYFPYEDQDRWEFEDEDIVWMSFPKIPCADGVNNGDTVSGSDVFGRFQETTVPGAIEVWQEIEIGYNPSFTGYYDYEEYTWDPSNFQFSSTDGLKIIVDDDYDDINPLITGGMLCEPGTPLTVTTGAGDLNWAGYFIPYTMNIMTALDETTLGKLTAIKTHDWSLYKKSGKWYGACPPGGTTVSYGDMVELFTNENEDFTFCWQSLSSSGESYERKETQYFTYNEKLDYQSIFVELGEEKPDEIAVYVDGVCKGAEVVDVDSLLEIRAYLLEEPQGQEIEIVAANGRSNQVNVKYQVVEEDGKLLDRSLFTDRSKMYQTVSLKASQEIPETEKVLTCYPNPFNPELIISFFITESSEEAEIIIYNVKGQRIRELKIENVNCKNNSVVWDGKDDAGARVSSGVYFIRVLSGNEVFTGKAVMMK
jgi:hypothetical protein